MLNGIFETGKLVIEIKMLNPEKILNILWSENIDIKKVTRIDIVTLKLKYHYQILLLKRMLLEKDHY